MAEFKLTIGGMSAVAVKNGATTGSHPGTAALFMGKGHLPVLALPEASIVALTREFARPAAYYLAPDSVGWVLIDVRGCEVSLGLQGSSTIQLGGTGTGALDYLTRLEWIYSTAETANPFDIPLGPAVPSRLHLDRGRLEAVPYDPNDHKWAFPGGNIPARYVADAALWSVPLEAGSATVKIDGDLRTEITLAVVAGQTTIEASMYSNCGWYGEIGGGFDYEGYAVLGGPAPAVPPVEQLGGVVKPGSEKCAGTLLRWL